MTQNQIRYWTLEEQKRANRANEAETHRSNVVREVETNRHNVVTETETERHNRATELLSLTQVNEQQRHNMVTELQADRQQAEVERSNLEKESNARNQIALGYANVGLGYANLAETQRHNTATEQRDLLSLAETQRYNTLRANIDSERNDETLRANKAAEDQRRLEWITSYGQKQSQQGEQQRHNVAVETETNRSNQVQEFWKGLETISDTVESQTRSVKNISQLVGGK